MYKEKLEPLLEDIENKEIEVAGGSVVGIVLSVTNSLINYICNLTLGKKKYLDVQDEVMDIQKNATELKKQTLEFIDKDKEILEEILLCYKNRNEEPDKLNNVYKKSVEFCLDVTKSAVEVLKLVERISKVGNKMLSSDFKISCFYAFSSVESSIVNVKINLDSLDDENYKNSVKEEYRNLLNRANEIKENILKDYEV